MAIDIDRACPACKGKGMRLFPSWDGDDVEWDICNSCKGEGTYR